MSPIERSLRVPIALIAALILSGIRLVMPGRSAPIRLTRAFSATPALRVGRVVDRCAGARSRRLPPGFARDGKRAGGKSENLSLPTC